MANLKLTLACEDYDRTRALKEGLVKPDGIDLNYVALPVEEILETFPTADRAPVWAELFTVRPEIHNSEMRLLDRPGWGI